MMKDKKEVDIKDNFKVINPKILQIIDDEKIKVVNSKSLTNMVSFTNKSFNFLYRDRELSHILNFFQNNQILFLIDEVGGVGKTSLAREFLKQNLKNFSYLAWINYENNLKRSFINGFNLKVKSYDDKDNYQDLYKNILSELKKLNGQNLLILDNFNNFNELLKIKKLFGNFKILIISRIDFNGDSKIKLNTLSPDASRELFTSYCNIKVNEKDLSILLNKIGFHPLMIEVFAKSISDKNSIDKFLKIFKNKDTPVVNIKKDTKLVIFKYLEIIFKVNNLDEKLLFLKWFSLLPPIELSLEDLFEYLNIQSKNEFIDSLNQLVKIGWIRKIDNKFKLPKIISEFIIYYYKPTFKESEKLILSITKKLNFNKKDNSIIRFKYIIFVENILKFFKEENEQITHLASNLALLHNSLGEFKEALKLNLKSVDMFEKLLNTFHPDLATSYNNLSLTYLSLNDLDKALYFSLKSLKIRKRILNEYHPDLSLSYHHISEIYRQLKEFDKAKEYNLKDIKIHEKISDEVYLYLAVSYSKLSSNYKAEGDLKNALKFSIKSLKIRERLLDEFNLDLANSYNAVSLIYKLGQNNNEALKFNLKAIKIKSKILHQHHPSIAISYSNHSSIYQSLKKFEIARKYIVRAIEILDVAFPNGHKNLESMNKNLKIIEKNLISLRRVK